MKFKEILLLEDEEVIGSIYKKYFDDYGCDTIWTKTVSASKDALSGKNPDLFLIDLGIKGEEESGMDLIPYLRSNYKNSKIIMLSNYSDFQMRDSAIRAGADDYLVKINYPPKVLIKYLENLN